MSGLDLVLQSITTKKIYLPQYFWGSYINIIKTRNLNYDFYENLNHIENNINTFKNSAIIICDPNNPLGDKYNDTQLINLIKKLNNTDAIVIIDSPYRRVFSDNNNFYTQTCLLENTILVESFSKSIGLSGQRIGFVHSVNPELMDELAIRLMYASNGVNGFAQLLVEKIYTTKEGQIAADNFKQKTRIDIKKNIEYLENKNLLAHEFFTNSKPTGIFTVVNMSENELLKHHIASVSLSFFTKNNKKTAAKYSRICVSVPHKEFINFFSKIK
jgi:aspartate/methionine/tyrosine aminotransferase